MSVEDPGVSCTAGVMLPDRGGECQGSHWRGCYVADKEFLSQQETTVMCAAHLGWQAKSSN